MYSEFWFILVNMKRANKEKNYNKIKFILCFTFLLIFFFLEKVQASSLKDGIESFPESYRPYLYALEEKYPNWNFTALETGLDWEYVIQNENVFGKNLVPKSYSDRWKNTKEGEYNVEVDAGWVDSSKQAVEYAMDPRNFLNEVRIFQFETLSANNVNSNQNAIEKILYGTEFYQRKVEYYDQNGYLISTDKTYSDLILAAAKTSSVSSYHLASRIKQEVGPFLSHHSISGKVTGFEGLYNFYNIGATSSSEPMGAIKNGLQYAKDGKGASLETKQKYLIPWNNKEKAITGGGIFIGSSYINIGQNTIYLQKFHVVDNKGGSLFWHQYMTNVLAPYSEGKLVYTGYKNSNLLNLENHFIIPVYQNMPELPVESPNINPDDYQDDNTKVYADVTNTLNVRSGPSTSYEVITTVASKEEMIRIAKGKQIGERWDRVTLENGIVGYVFQDYLQELPEEPEITVEKIEVTIDRNKINKKERMSLQVKVLPEEAKNKEVSFASKDSSIAMVDEKGEILGLRSGITTITVTSYDNPNVKAEVDIEVYSPVTGLTVDKEDIMLGDGESTNIMATVYPEDANNKKVKYSSSNSEIVSIDQTGKMQAIKQGEAVITVETEENKIQKQIKVTVLKKLDEGEVIFHNLTVEGNEISGLNLAENTVEKIISNIETNYDIVIYNKKGEVLLDYPLVGTGCKIELKNDQNKVVAKYDVIVYGDINGDGKINSIDLLVLQKHILEIEPLQGVFFKAGNISKNGKKPSSVDSLHIQRHILDIKKIEQ